jgi:hypothetical protein
VAPTLVNSYYVQSSGTSTAAVTTPNFTPSNGEVLVVKLETWDTATAMGAPTGGSQTYTSRVTEAPGGFRPWVGIYTAVVSGSPGSMTVSSTPAASARYSMLVERWSGAQLDATPATGNANAGSGAPQCSITTEAADSVVSWVSGDAQAVDPATRAYLNSAVDEALRDEHTTVDGVAYYAYAVIASAGAVTVGLSAPTGQQWCIVAVEVQAAGGATVTGTAAATLGGLAGAATGTPTTFGTAAAALGGSTAAATGTPTTPGTAAVGLGALGAAAAGTRTVLGVAAAPSGGLAATSSGTRTVLGTAAATLGGLAASATAGASTKFGIAAAALGALGASATGTRSTAGTAAAALGGLTAGTSGAAPATSLAGNAHGPLALASGAVTVHTGTIAGAIT